MAYGYYGDQLDAYNGLTDEQKKLADLLNQQLASPDYWGQSGVQEQLSPQVQQQNQQITSQRRDQMPIGASPIMVDGEQAGWADYSRPKVTGFSEGSPSGQDVAKLADLVYQNSRLAPQQQTQFDTGNPRLQAMVEALKPQYDSAGNIDKDAYRRKAGELAWQADAARMKESDENVKRMSATFDMQKKRAELAQLQAKGQAEADDAKAMSTGQLTAKQYERMHGKIPSGFEIYRTETGETDIRPAQGGKQYVELQDRVNKFDSSAKSMKEYGDQIDKLANHPGRESATGFSSITNPIAFPGGDAKTFLNELETFQSQAFLSNIDKLRGTGPLSNVEGEKLQAAVGNLNPSSDEATFVKNMKYVKQKFNELKNVAAKEADQARGDLKRSGGSGGMVVDVSGEKMALSLPAGTKFRLPDGRTGTAR